MKCMDEMSDAEKAWEMVKKMDEFRNLLWEMYAKEFTEVQYKELLMKDDFF